MYKKRGVADAPRFLFFASTLIFKSYVKFYTSNDSIVNT